VPDRLDGEKPVTIYFEDLPLEEQARFRALRTSELEALGSAAYPLQGRFMGKPIMVLGPCHRFAPYDDPCYGAPTLGSNYQLMCEGEEGRFITFGSGVEVNGRRLCTRIPPRRPKPFLGWLP